MVALVLASPAFAADPAPPSDASHSGFAEYLVEHQDDLAPFFSKYGDELLKLAVPYFMSLATWILALTVLVGWGADVLLSRGFASFYSPAFARFREAIIYATGSLILNVVFLALLATATLLTIGLVDGGWISLGLAVLMIGAALVAQVMWIMYLYRSRLPISVAFYLAVFAAHAIVAGLVAVPLVASRAPATVTDFMDHVVTPKLTAEIKSTRRELATAQAALNDVQGKSTDLQNQLLQAQSDADQLRQQIADKKQSDAYVFSQIMKVRASGDLAATRQQLTAFTGKFPGSPLTAAANAQLAEVSTALNTDEALKQQQAADAAKAAEQARADLVAKAQRGDVTLSEMREALLGKSRDEVKGLFGLPSLTGSDSWTYTPQMVLNPLTNRRHGLVVYFLEGSVQGVDYYGSGIAR